MHQKELIFLDMNLFNYNILKG